MGRKDPKDLLDLMEQLVYLGLLEKKDPKALEVPQEMLGLRVNQGHQDGQDNQALLVKMDHRVH